MSQQREQLLGYLLGALEDDERDEVERQLAASPELRRQLEQLRQQLLPLDESRETVDPPPGLAARTCRLVEALGQVRDPSPAASTPPQKVQPAMRASRGEPLAAMRGASLLDVVVAAGVCLALSLLFFPALVSSRELARRSTCQDNLRRMGIALSSYSQNFASIPAMDAHGNAAFAGMVAVTLNECGLIDEDRTLLCPGGVSDLMRTDFRIPTRREIDQAWGRHLLDLQGRAGGNYGYTIGYQLRGTYYTPRVEGRQHYVLMSDSPDLSQPNLMSVNHGAFGMNVLFDDQRVVFIRSCRIPGRDDDTFRNHAGFVKPGLSQDDSVIGTSDWRHW